MVSIFKEVVQKHVMCCCSGSPNQFIGVYNTSGDNLSTIKYHEGFLGQRIGAASCLAFHPYKVHNSSHLMYAWCCFYGLFIILCLTVFFSMRNCLIIFPELLNLVDSWNFPKMYMLYVFNLFWWHRFSKSITSTQVYLR